MYNNEVVQEDLSLILNQNIDLSKFKNKSVLITGATGMLASYYMYTLMYLNDVMNYNIKIYPLVRNISKLDNLVNLPTRKDIFPIEQDVCDEINIEDKIDYIIHMASSANPKTIKTNPVGIIEANVFGTLNVLNLAKQNDAKVIFTSTREVYGKMDTDIITEEDMGILDCLELRSCYPESKKLAENLIVSYAYQHGIKYEIVRIAHSYGPGMIIKDDGRIMSDLINNVVNSEDIVLKSTGEAKRAFCYIVDATTALLHVTLSNEDNQVYNIANETEEISIRDLAESLTNWFSDKNIQVVYDIQENNNQYVKFKRVRLDTSKLESLGWKPVVSLEEGVKKTVNYFDKEAVKKHIR